MSTIILKQTTYITFFALLMMALASCGGGKKTDLAEQNKKIQKTTAYSTAHTHYCPMHPEETGVEGDNCPICGMHLVPMEDKAMDMTTMQPHENHDHERQSLPEPVQDIGDQQQVYVCPMHPHITGEEGGNCPICGMHLVPKNEANGSNEGSKDKPKGAFLIDSSYIQTLGVKTSSVTYHELGREIRSFGRIAPNTRMEYAVDVRTKGWIVDLPIGAVGDIVKKGDLLFTYYSPDLMNAQSDFLIGMRVVDGTQRLRLYGMGNKAIAKLKKSGKILEKTPFYAPADGTVTMLNVRKGGHVNEGEGIIKLQDFSKVWVNANVPVRDSQFLKAGTAAQITLPETGASYNTFVDFIHPVNDPKSRTVLVRLVLDNPDGSLKIDTYVDAVFNADGKSRLAVPAEAVLYGGMGAYVIEDVGDGYFRPIMVKTGITSQGLTEITSGLSLGQSIVKSGQFMLDAESSLKGGMAAMRHDHGGEQMEGMTSQPASQDGDQSRVL